MADMTAAQIAEWFASQGMKVPADVAKKAEAEKTDAIESYLHDRLVGIENENDRIAAAAEFRTFFENVAAQMLSFKGDEKNKPGRGDHKYVSRRVQFDIPGMGYLKVELQRDK